jgi:hypothetical protein
MSNEFVNRVTLEYMSSYKPTLSTENGVDAADLKFYKQRIYNLTREMLNGTPNPCLKKQFDMFVQCAVDHFKATDMTDILQAELTDCKNEQKYGANGTMNMDNILFNKKVNVATLDKFVVTNKSKTNAVKMPAPREVDLKDPKLQTKGVKPKMKKNIVHNHEDTNKKKETGKHKNTQVIEL